MLYFITGLVLVAVGVTMLARPQLIYKLAESWKHDGEADEVPRGYVRQTRFSGVMCIVAGLAGLLAPFLS